MSALHSFRVTDEDLKPLAGKVVVITGASSGIGLASAKLLLSIGAFVIAGDLTPSPVEHKNHTYLRTDVSDWANLKALFNTAKQLHGRVDHVFANAGIGGITDYMPINEKFDANGELEEPPKLVYEVNLRGMANTCYLGLHHMRKQEPAGGSIVATASGSSFQPFRMTDYATAKTGVLGFTRAIAANLVAEKIPIRMNAITPGWTNTGLMPPGVLDKIGAPEQSSEAVARSALHLMADPECQGHVVYSEKGVYWEIENQALLPTAQRILGTEMHDDIYGRMKDYMIKQYQAQQQSSS